MRGHRAFTLVEVLIVVVILGILSAIVVPQFSSATEDASRTATWDQLNKLREAVSVYYVRHGNVLPNITAGDGTWGELVSMSNEYLRFPPKNRWVPEPAAKIIILGTGPDSGYQTTHGWIYDPATGNLWAGSFDGADQPFPRP
jgi:general secretion pathway protein G